MARELEGCDFVPQQNSTAQNAFATTSRNSTMPGPVGGGLSFGTSGGLPPMQVAGNSIAGTGGGNFNAPPAQQVFTTAPSDNTSLRNLVQQTSGMRVAPSPYSSNTGFQMQLSAASAGATPAGPNYNNSNSNGASYNVNNLSNPFPFQPASSSSHQLCSDATTPTMLPPFSSAFSVDASNFQLLSGNSNTNNNINLNPNSNQNNSGVDLMMQVYTGSATPTPFPPQHQPQVQQPQAPAPPLMALDARQLQALQHYQQEIQALYERCMLNAGYSPQDIHIGSPAYRNFVAMVSRGEWERIQALLAPNNNSPSGRTEG